jgi:hypothetical protein
MCILTVFDERGDPIEGLPRQFTTYSAAEDYLEEEGAELGRRRAVKAIVTEEGRGSDTYVWTELCVYAGSGIVCTACCLRELP